LEVVETIGTAQHRALVKLLIRKRMAAKLRQGDVAKRMRQYQSWVARIESGQRRIDIIEFFALARAIGFDPYKALKSIFR
jgi:transcriptional regulator with XRE-family HTH domain